MPTYVNGFGGTITVGATSIPVESWSVSVNCEILDTTNSGDNGWESNINGAKMAEGSAKAYLDTAALPFSTVAAGSSATIVLPVGSTGDSFSIPARISKVGVENPVKGVCTLAIDFKSNGAVTYPS